MSELENIVHHIVQHEEERKAEKIKLESEIKGLEEVLEHGISTKFVEEEVIYVYSPKTAHDMREKLEENYKQLHAQLTIPKSIAEQADKIAYYALKKEGAEEFHQWFDYKQDEYMDVVFAYLNPLTRDLVKVVEG
ncbi:hypothetical protein [Lactococcus lactis]|uniref:hypothetical protein n=1 Tax=Lactococcus lactis TaxID=1358 RepID=UPI00210E8E75|nr:hypothetical protein [Lactococcus lactis]MCQ4972191.1 hypothetical protein [Lactococcus lactis]MCQ4997997.1 hypothetical protein [Lactococcus lactis]